MKTDEKRIIRVSDLDDISRDILGIIPRNETITACSIKDSCDLLLDTIVNHLRHLTQFGFVKREIGVPAPIYTRIDRYPNCRNCRCVVNLPGGQTINANGLCVHCM